MEERSGLSQVVGKLAPRVLKIGGAAIVALVLFTNSFYSVAQTDRGVHTRFGEIVGVSGPGPHFKLPFVENVRHMPIATQTVSWQRTTENGQTVDSRLSTYSRDQQPAEIAMTLTWHVPGDEASVQRVATEWGSRDALYNAVIVPSATEGFKNIFGTYDAVSAIQRRAELNQQVLAAVRAQVQGKPVVIDSVQLQDISFSQAYEDAVEARMTAQVEVQRAEQQRQTRQIEADMTVITARANAEQTRLAGEAQASAIRARADALRSSPELVQLTLAEKWNGVLPTTMVPGGSVPMLNLGR